MHPKFREQGVELCTSLDQPDTSCPVNLEQKSAGAFNTAIKDSQGSEFIPTLLCLDTLSSGYQALPETKGVPECRITVDIEFNLLESVMAGYEARAHNRDKQNRKKTSVW